MIIFIIQVQKKASWIEDFQQFLTIYAMCVEHEILSLIEILLKLRNFHLT